MSTGSSNRQNILKNPPLLISILATAVVFTISILIIEQRRNIKVSRARLELAEETKRVNGILNNFFGDMYSGLAAIARIIDPHGQVNSFDSTAKEIMSRNTLLNTVSLIPGGVIKYTYP